MGQVTSRNSQNSRGMFAVSPYRGNVSLYEISNINLGSNFIAKLEIVSALNSFNLTWDQYHFNHNNCTTKYNPKVYLGTIQTASNTWNYDLQKGQTNGLPNLVPETQKSGSWPQKMIKFLFLNINCVIHILRWWSGIIVATIESLRCGEIRCCENVSRFGANTNWEWVHRYILWIEVVPR